MQPSSPGSGYPIRTMDQVEPGRVRFQVGLVFALALAFVLLTRLPVARPRAIDPDELGYLAYTKTKWLANQHALFMASARVLGGWVGDPYRGFLVLDMLVSALALTSVWWWLRALVRPATAAATTLVLAVAPTFWTYGAMAGNYTAIPLVGSFLLGVAVRTWREPKRWHPYAAVAVLAVGTGYRQDIGIFWLPVLLVILWRHRWGAALRAAGLFTVLNLAWIVPMIYEVGGWDQYLAKSREFSHEVIYLNSIWHLGFRDATARYVVKLGMALLWTFGPGLILAPRGMIRLVRDPAARPLAALLLLSVLPALAYHLLLAFGVPGYALHYAPAAVALMAFGAGRAVSAPAVSHDRAPAQFTAVAVVMAAFFCFYPTNYDRPGIWGDFERSFCRCTRIGLKTPNPYHPLTTWRTANTRDSAPDRAPLPDSSRKPGPQVNPADQVCSLANAPTHAQAASPPAVNLSGASTANGQ